MTRKSLQRLNRLAARQRDSKLPQVQLDVLIDLATHPASTRQAIAGRIGFNEVSLRRHLADLRRSGHVTRVTDEGDIRFVGFDVSAKGTALVESLAAALTE